MHVGKDFLIFNEMSCLGSQRKVSELFKKVLILLQSIQNDRPSHFIRLFLAKQRLFVQNVVFKHYMQLLATPQSISCDKGMGWSKTVLGFPILFLPENLLQTITRSAQVIHGHYIPLSETISQRQIMQICKTNTYKVKPPISMQKFFLGIVCVGLHILDVG